MNIDKKEEAEKILEIIKNRPDDKKSEIKDGINLVTLARNLAKRKVAKDKK